MEKLPAAPPQAPPRRENVVVADVPRISALPPAEQGAKVHLPSD